MMTESFSAMRWVLPLRRMPAVSTKRKSWEPRVTTSSTASRVVPAMGETMARSVPVRALSRVDLPTLGRPMMAILVSCSTKEPWERRRRGRPAELSVASCWLSVEGKSAGAGGFGEVGAGLVFFHFVFGGEEGFGRRRLRGLGEGGEDGVEEVADADVVLGGDGEDVGEAEAAEVFGGGGEGGGVDFVDGEEDGLAGAEEETGEGEVGGGEFGAAVDDHDDGGGFGEGGLGLAEDFGGDEGGVVGDDAAGVDDAGVAGLPLDEAVDAVAGDAGLVADDGAAGAGEAIEEGGFADVGAAADGD